MMRIALALFAGMILWAGVGHAGQLDALWTAPTKNADNTPLTNLASYRLYWVLFPMAPCPGTQFIVINSPTPSPLPNTTVGTNLTGLTQGMTYNTAVTSVSTNGRESTCSPVVSAVAKAGGTEPLVMLTVNTHGQGTGGVSSVPVGLSCSGVAGTTCSKGFPSGTAVTVTATPLAGSVFARWVGECEGTNRVCTVTMTTARLLNAIFEIGTAPPPRVPGQAGVSTTVINE